jgi:hypothetical protein
VRYPTDVAGDSWGNLVAVAPFLLEPVERAGRSTATRLRVRHWVDRLRRVG